MTQTLADYTREVLSTIDAQEIPAAFDMLECLGTLVFLQEPTEAPAGIEGVLDSFAALDGSEVDLAAAHLILGLENNDEDQIVEALGLRDTYELRLEGALAIKSDLQLSVDLESSLMSFDDFCMDARISQIVDSCARKARVAWANGEWGLHLWWWQPTSGILQRGIQSRA